MITEKDIILAVALVGNTTQEELSGEGKSESLVIWRNIACYLLREKKKYSYLKIGRIFNRDRTTILLNLRKFGVLLQSDPHRQSCLDDVLVLLNAPEPFQFDRTEAPFQFDRTEANIKTAKAAQRQLDKLARETQTEKIMREEGMWPI